MGYFAGAHDLRNLLAVATMLRRLAEDAAHHDSRRLYRLAAAALEKRAGEMAMGQVVDMVDGALHRPVNLVA